MIFHQIWTKAQSMTWRPFQIFSETCYMCNPVSVLCIGVTRKRVPKHITDIFVERRRLRVCLLFMPPDWMIGTYCFSCRYFWLFVCLFVYQSVANFNLRYNLWSVRLHIWHAYFTNEVLSIDTKVNDLVTLAVIFWLKIFLTVSGQSVLQTHLVSDIFSQRVPVHGCKTTFFNYLGLNLRPQIDWQRDSSTCTL